MGKSWIDLVFQKSGKHLSSKILRCEKRYSADVRQTSGELLSKLWCNWRGDVFGFMHFGAGYNAEKNSIMRKNTYIILLKYVCIYIYIQYIYIFPYASGGNSDSVSFFSWKNVKPSFTFCGSRNEAPNGDEAQCS